jgi:hypothetical protein
MARASCATGIGLATTRSLSNTAFVLPTRRPIVRNSADVERALRQARSAAAAALPFGVGERHVWLHRHCRDRWAEARRSAAVDTLGIIGITEPSKDEAPR